MKKLVALILAMALFSVGSVSLASSCPLPEGNTTSEIKFSGFEWYTDYTTTLQTATDKGFVNLYDWSRDNFKSDSWVTPHWNIILNSIPSFAGSEKGCGGYLLYTANLPNVAGYKIDELSLYLMWDPLIGAVPDFKAQNAVQFYMAKYSFDVADKKGAYEDLVNKLKKLYGDQPYVDTYGWNNGTNYTVWVNDEHALIGISYDEYDVELVYMAPGAEEKLVQVEKRIMEQEIENAANDYSGL